MVDSRSLANNSCGHGTDFSSEEDEEDGFEEVWQGKALTDDRIRKKDCSFLACWECHSKRKRKEKNGVKSERGPLTEEMLRRLSVKY